jgi:hypothetical protein
MSYPPTRCAACGTETHALATVSDPFTDQCYGVCSSCLEPIHTAMYRQIGLSLTARREEAAQREREAVSATRSAEAS